MEFQRYVFFREELKLNTKRVPRATSGFRCACSSLSLGWDHALAGRLDMRSTLRVILVRDSCRML